MNSDTVLSIGLAVDQPVEGIECQKEMGRGCPVCWGYCPVEAHDRREDLEGEAKQEAIIQA